MRLVGNDIVDVDPVFIMNHQIEMMTLPDLLSQSDYVSMNCDLNPTSHHLMNAESTRYDEIQCNSYQYLQRSRGG